MPQFKINSLVSSAFVGITDPSVPGYFPVEINPTQDVWKITPQPDRSVRFSIGNLAYTGMDSQGTVTASNNPGEDLKWRVTRRPDCEAFTIEVIDVNPVVGWAVADSSNSHSQIVVREIDASQCNPAELFAIVRSEA